ncbi:tetraacyldisaccharide 4'-kinase [Porphyromonadaceae bacterium W3.11]|nr:tetraacyldisaccharide 4'-kinase [Porphyromonadaceae bacterium W3.11]
MLNHRHWLLRIPSAIYGMAVGVRNFAYERGWLASEKSSIPTICVGNLAVGGTGKTPHIELLIRLLKNDYRIALLSRGYGRKTRGPIIASNRDTAWTIGDEPFQIKRKFPEVMVYIDGDRRRALHAMEEMPENERPDVVLMDDGFQHRSVIPSYTILLSSYQNLYIEDFFMPYGSLRDGRKEAFRADTIIITHTPRDVTPVELRLKKEALNLLAFQDQYFSRVKYESPRCLFDPSTPDERPRISGLRLNTPVLVLTGIAEPTEFQELIARKFTNVESYIEYPDHHRFTNSEVTDLVERLEEDPNLFILTTEKDAMRLLPCEDLIPSSVKERIWYIPIFIDISLDCRMGLLRKAKRAIKNNGLTI